MSRQQRASAVSASSGPRSGWHLLAETTRRHVKVVGAGVAAGQLWTVGRVLIPTVVSVAINSGIIAGHTSELIWLGFAIIGLGALSSACSGLRRYFAQAISFSLETDLRAAMFENLQRLDFSFYDRAQTGQLMARAATDLQQVNGFGMSIPITIANFVTVAVVTGILFSINVVLAAIALASLPILSVSAKRFSSRIHPASMALQQELSGLSTIVEETVAGVRAVKGFGAEAIQVDQLAAQAGRVFDRIIALAKVRAFFNPLLDVLPALSLAFVLWYGGNAAIHHQLSVGSLIAFNLYVAMLVGPLQMVGQTIAQAQRAVASATRVAEVLNAHPGISDAPDARSLPAGGGEVVLEHVSFAYAEAGTLVLDHVDLVITPGESVALVGATGSGKSTIARLLSRFYDPTEGRILLDGADLRSLRLQELRPAVATVFEDTFLFSMSVRDNIAFGQPDALDEAVLRASRLSGADDFIRHLPLGYDTVLGERGFSLSGGQRQRIALARAILAEPRLLILDDATSAVDATKEHEIRDALAAVMTGRTTLVISHRPATIALAERVLLLDGGRIVASGSHEELLAGSARYRDVLAHAIEYEVDVDVDVEMSQATE
jgi:ATP-binding cassette, subfamily B, bacterial